MANIFQNGDPVNVDALNDLVSRLVTLEAQNGQLFNTTSMLNNNMQTVSKIPIVYSGTETVSIAANGLQVIDITSKLNLRYTSAQPPTVVATVASTLKAKDQVSVSVHKSAGTWKIYVTSNTAKDTLHINWISVYMQAAN